MGLSTRLEKIRHVFFAGLHHSQEPIWEIVVACGGLPRRRVQDIAHLRFETAASPLRPARKTRLRRKRQIPHREGSFRGHTTMIARNHWTVKKIDCTQSSRSRYLPGAIIAARAPEPMTEPKDHHPLDRWLQSEVAATFDAMKADPACAISVDDAFAAAHAHHAKGASGQG